MQRESNTNPSQSQLRRWGVLSLCTGLAAFTLLAGTPASASTEPDDELAGNFDEPMKQGEGHGEGHATGKSSSNFSSSSTTIDDDGTWTVTNKNGKVTVEHDGKKIDKDRVRERRGQIEILDENGKVIKRLPAAVISLRGNGLNRMFLTPPPPPAIAPRAPRAPQNFRVSIDSAPKVMLGVTMSDADEELLEQLGIDSGVLLVTVRKDLPADKAGLQPKDVIFEADGESDLDEGSLRDILKEKNPGDELKVKVKRKGEDKEFTIKLEKYDPGMLGNAPTPPGFGEEGEGFDPEQLKAMLAEIEAQVKEQAAALREKMNATDWNQVRDDVSKELDLAMKQMAEAREKAAAAGHNWWRNFNEGQWNQPSPNVFRIRPGQAATIEHADTDKKLDKLAEQLEKLNSRLDEMEKKIDKK
ncbi:MAG TPA: PDZ domain-containing protein [Phycisphaerales bacterium]